MFSPTKKMDDATLAERSRNALYETSDDDDAVSILPDEQHRRVNRTLVARHDACNRVCATRPQEEEPLPMSPSLLHRFEVAARDGRIACRASQLDASRIALRRTEGVLEVMPGWFARQATMQTWRDCQGCIKFLAEQHGGRWEAKLRTFCARHPLPCVATSPMLQNMRIADFMHVSLLYALRTNRASVDACDACLAQVTDKFRETVRATLLTE